MSLIGRIQDKGQRSYRSLLYACGIETLLYKFGANKDLILMFHNVLPKTNRELNLRNISEGDFRKLLIYLKRKYTLVSLNEISKSSPKSNRIAITFDDGLLNNLRYALPVLTELNIPATIFVTTSWLIGENILWPDELSLLLKKSKAESIIFDGIQFERQPDSTFKSMTNAERLDQFLIGKPQQEICKFLDNLKKELNYEPSQDFQIEEEWRVMKGEELKLLAASTLIDIGSHSVSHRNLALLNANELESEFSESKKYLEQVLQKPVRSFAFPFGSYSQDVLNAAIAAGYTELIGVNEIPKFRNANSKIHFRMGLYNDRSHIENLHLINSYFE